jgi:molybdopterin-containing oxidoreductase family membrane subunit
VDCIFNRINSFLWGSCIIYTVSTGIGTWGLNKQSVGMGYHKLRLVGWYRSRWNFNFCGITLFRQRWRMAINRSEAMTIFSVIQAGLFQPYTWASMVGVLGFAYTESFGSLWVNFNSPLLWMYLRYLLIYLFH